MIFSAIVAPYKKIQVKHESNDGNITFAGDKNIHNYPLCKIVWRECTEKGGERNQKFFQNLVQKMHSRKFYEDYFML